MYTYTGRQNTLRMSFNRSGKTSFSVKALTEGAEACKPVTLSNDELRALRDRINSRLGDSNGAVGPSANVGTPTPPPIPADVLAAVATLQTHRDSFDTARTALDIAMNEMEDMRDGYDEAFVHLDNAIEALSP